MGEGKSGRWRGIIFSLGCLSHLNSISSFSMMILKAASPSFQCLLKQLHMEDGTTLQAWHGAHKPGLCPAWIALWIALSHFCWWSTTFPCHPGSTSESRSPLLCSSSRSSRPLCPGISPSALSLLFVLVLPKTRLQNRCYCKIVQLLHLTPHL